MRFRGFSFVLVVSLLSVQPLADEVGNYTSCDRKDKN